MTAGQLAVHENVRKPTMTRTIQALVDRDLARRTPDPLDGRVTWLAITTEGSKLLQRTRRRTDEFLAKRLGSLSAEERAVLSRASDLLETIAEKDPGT
jgi:DNA-binding MarR family transcriptional regulator